ncbi:imelysin family protein [Psychrobacter sp. AOP22-C1-22]|uniref:imelysin family protein n=1 Tax=unclassified Psychrobacter TaxID=196806 RepID=UPI001788A096|nr:MULTISPECIES: imelysin family protein [unclassified Psychrobacter]MBE0407040.1 peptidase M75 [Psychrobacter sp. FME6]MBE0445822.1 peptidase M75 [Psychrobacter sp. FME5]MDN5802292.1 peptidase M75 [Psychrobacter sp.]MDN5897678.1 peptidase M75 [Psychrobacter sp.]
MKINHALAMAISALSAGLLISCVKPADENKASDVDSQVAQDSAEPKTSEGSASTDNNSEKKITTVDISADTEKTYLTHVANEMVVPAYADAAKQSDLLHDLAQKNCQQAPVSGDELQALRDQWLVLAQAWASAEMTNFGPATESMSNLYINYYPDERGLVHKGVADLIAANPKLTAEQLANESAIVQGVPGLEEALFANDSLDAGQCAYVISASSALSTRLKDIEEDWQQNATDLLAIDKTAESDQGLNQWFNSLLSLIETMKSTAIDQPLGLTGKAKGHLPAATAGQSRAIINAKLGTLNKAMTDPVLTAILGNSNDNDVADKLSTALADTTTLLAQMPEDLATADKATQQELYDHLTTITRLIKRQLIPTLGIRVGFNSTDGD